MLSRHEAARSFTALPPTIATPSAALPARRLAWLPAREGQFVW